MLSVAEAQRLVLERALPLPARVMPLSPDVLGLILAEDVVSDLDMPPFDKAMMDGYAVRAHDLPDGRAVLSVVEEVTAGQMPRLRVGAGQATRIMTGAPLPAGADAVVQVEHTSPSDENHVRIEGRPVRPGVNVLARGQEMRRGDVVLATSKRLGPQDLGILATVGRTSARLHSPARVAVLCTGDEIVEPGETPAVGHIRNGNGPMLAAQVRRAGGEACYLGIARDELDSLRAKVAEGLRSQVLVLSGGVSAGKLDLVPQVLGELGVQPHFHKVAMKPGKPAFFGTQGDTLVFGLPGNPVSAFVCFELFVRPAIRRLRNHPATIPGTVRAALSEDFAYRTDRPTYHPAWLDHSADGPWQVRAVPWFGSPDLLGLSRANALLYIPPGDNQFQAGHACEVLPVDEPS
jgi:molybdopterin molybdotransferase